MPVCARCNKENATWSCVVCGRQIGPECTRIIDGRTFCLEHAPKQAATDETKPTRDLSGMLKALLTVLFLLIGTGIMLYIMQWYASKMSEIPIKEIATIVEIFQTVGLLIVEGLAGLFVILLIAYGVLRRRQ